MWDWAKVISEAGKLFCLFVNDAYTIEPDPNTPFAITTATGSLSFHRKFSNKLSECQRALLLKCTNDAAGLHEPIIWRIRAGLLMTSDGILPSGQLILNVSGRIHTNKYKDDGNQHWMLLCNQVCRGSSKSWQSLLPQCAPAGAPDAMH